MTRLVKPGGMVVMCPGGAHDYLTAHGFESGEFLKPGDGIKRKYWKKV